MVTSVSVPEGQTQDGRGTRVPLASPPTNETNHLQSDRSKHGFSKNNPFLSPNLSETSTADSEGTSSGQEEFHLERYSSTLKRRQQENFARRQSKKRPKPDLNVVTRFPNSQAQAVAAGVKVEDVQAQRKAAKTRPKSIVSAKAEHVYEHGFSRRAKAVAGVKDLAARRKEKKSNAGTDQRKLTTPNGLQSDASSRALRADESPLKPVLIGISVSKDEAAAHHQKLGHESAVSLITPGTPQIIVTPAAEDAPWHQAEPQTLKPASSIYSQAVRPPLTQSDGTDAPPVPHVPPRFDVSNQRDGPKAPKSILMHYESFESVPYESPQHSPYPTDDRAARQSFESQQQILPQNGDTARPKSQGWWNLALSPMLSRAGTIKSVFTRTSPEDDKVPPLPAGRSRRLSRSNTLDLDASPDTPRRIGMASARASTWSRWTSWEKTRNQKGGSSRDALSEDRADTPPVPSLGTSANAAAISGVGLAAEYFHACGIEQLSGEPYFECENHSCSEKLPKLQSIFDEGAKSEVANSGLGVVPLVMPDPDSRPGLERNLSYLTGASSEPAELSPNVREADVATIAKAKTIETPPLRDGTPDKQADEATLRALEGTGDSIPAPALRPVPPPPRNQSTRYPNIAAIVPPPTAASAGPAVISPGPISPEAQRNLAPQGAVPMSEVSHGQPQQINYYHQYHYQQGDAQAGGSTPAPVRQEANQGQKESSRVEQRPISRDTETHEEKEEKESKPSLFSRLKQCAKARKLRHAATDPTPKKRKRIIAIFVALLVMIVAIILLATQLTRGDHTPIQQQWLNLTGYPPMPIGISTIIRPDITKSQTGCVSPNMWSCAVPKEEHTEIAPNNPDQPNFRFEIKFKNGTVPSNMTVPLRRRIDNPFSQNLFTPNPAPPSRADQIFMGNTTDNATQPFDGEVTPFFMTFIPAFPIDPSDPSVTGNLTAGLTRRDDNFTNVIPAPNVLDDGSAAPANLLPTDPFPFSQPIRLYNRGLQDEHYGFYTYYDKAIFLSIDAGNVNSTAAPSSQDESGGSLRTDARARCTFSQTRFLVQIFTNPGFGANLLGSRNDTIPSAINYTPPGSFPYPTTVTIDRHGGNINKKLAYCYAMNDLQVQLDDEKVILPETRNVGGSGLINAAPSLIQIEGQEQPFDENAGGIDGGEGGCECRWQNWN